MSTETAMNVDETREVMVRYLGSGHTDSTVMSQDVVFRIMATGEEHRTPAGIAAMLHWLYQVAFEATAETRMLLVGAGSAVWEGTFVGRHVGEFAGVPATGKDVRVPLSVCYELRAGRIVEGRVYFETPAFLAQVGALAGQ